MGQRFSVRHGYRSPAQEILVRENAPDDLRYYITVIVEDVGMSPTEMRSAVCRVLCVRSDASSWSEYPKHRGLGERPDLRMCLVQSL